MVIMICSRTPFPQTIIRDVGRCQEGWSDKWVLGTLALYVTVCDLITFLSLPKPLCSLKFVTGLQLS